MLLQVGWALLALTIDEYRYLVAVAVLLHYLCSSTITQIIFRNFPSDQERAQGLFITGLDDQNDLKYRIGPD